MGLLCWHSAISDCSFHAPPTSLHRGRTADGFVTANALASCEPNAEWQTNDVRRTAEFVLDIPLDRKKSKVLGLRWRPRGDITSQARDKGPFTLRPVYRSLVLHEPELKPRGSALPPQKKQGWR